MPEPLHRSSPRRHRAAPSCGPYLTRCELEHAVCHSCDAVLLLDDEVAEVYLDRRLVEDAAGGQWVMVADMPDSAFGPFLVHADPCYLHQQDRYKLA